LKNIKGHPFFESEQMQEGSISYEGIIYPHIFFWYDLVNDEIIIKDFTSNFNIRLLPEKIRYFSILNHVFIRLVQDSTSDASWKNGFYDRLYEGKIMVVAKRKKQINHSTNAEEVINWFQQYNNYFIIKDDVYYHITNLKSLLSVFRDKKKEIRKFMEEIKPDYRKQREKTMIEIAGYYDKLKK
jgi:hypothetical protein